MVAHKSVRSLALPVMGTTRRWRVWYDTVRILNESSEHADVESVPGRAVPVRRQLRVSFRPATYWPDLPTAQAMMAQVKGTTRREAVEALLPGPADRL